MAGRPEIPESPPLGSFLSGWGPAATGIRSPRKTGRPGSPRRAAPTGRAGAGPRGYTGYKPYGEKLHVQSPDLCGTPQPPGGATLGSGLLLFLGNDDSAMNYPDNTYPFRQDSSFLYFFGVDRPRLRRAHGPGPGPHCGVRGRRHPRRHRLDRPPADPGRSGRPGRGRRDRPPGRAGGTPGPGQGPPGAVPASLPARAAPRPAAAPRPPSGGAGRRRVVAVPAGGGGPAGGEVRGGDRRDRAGRGHLPWTCTSRPFARPAPASPRPRSWPRSPRRRWRRAPPWPSR